MRKPLLALPFDTRTRAASALAAAGFAFAAACSPGAPATEQGANVAEFSTIPGVERAAPNEPAASAGADEGAGVTAVGGTEASVPAGGIAPPSPPGPTSSDESTSDVGSSSTGGAPSSGEPAPEEDPSNEGEPPGATEPVAGEATCALEVTVTTAPHGGRYTPRNVGAIWIADGTGAYIKSLDVWGNRRLSHVEAWNAATRVAGVPQDRVDAVTGATQATHRTHVVAWDCTDHLGQLVADGSYRVYFEVTEANAAGPNHFEAFEKGPSAATRQASAPSFEGIQLSFQP